MYSVHIYRKWLYDYVVKFEAVLRLVLLFPCYSRAFPVDDSGSGCRNVSVTVVIEQPFLTFSVSAPCNCPT